MKNRFYLSSLFLVIILMCMSPVYGQESKVSTHSIMAYGKYAKESEDCDWSIRITGNVPSLCGAYILLHDVNGKIIHKGKIPHGEYAVDNPFVMDIKKDGVAGDYKIIIIGQQEDHLGINLPLTTLPFEVYGGTNFALGRDEKSNPAFKVEKEKEVVVGAYKGHLSILDEKNKAIIDTAKESKYAGTAGLDKHKAFRYCNYVTLKAEPGKIYFVDDYKTFYFKFKPAVYLTFEPEKWFNPDVRLDEVKWWRKVMEK